SILGRWREGGRAGGSQTYSQHRHGTRTRSRTMRTRRASRRSGGCRCNTSSKPSNQSQIKKK
ncbi:sgf29 tudor-like domain protein, partial [Nannochloropsis oceanica]